MSSTCWFPSPLIINQEVATVLENICESGQCRHVGAIDLLPRDGRFRAVFDAPCFDPSVKTYKCEKTGSLRLYLHASRGPSPSKVSMKVQPQVELIPASHLGIEGGVERHGTVLKSLPVFVLHPCYPKALSSEWSHVEQVIRLDTSSSAAAAIEVRVQVRRESAKPLSQVISLPVSLQPVQEDGVMKEEGTSLDTNLATIVIAESVKLLLKDGWDFFKDQVNDHDGFIQLNIGGEQLTETSQTTDLVAKAVSSSRSTLSFDLIDQISGLNTQLETLSVKRKNLQQRLDRGSTEVDNAKTKTEFDLTGKEIEKAKSELWRLIQQTKVVELK